MTAFFKNCPFRKLILREKTWSFRISNLPVGRQVSNKECPMSKYAMSDINLIYGHHPVTEAIRAGKAVEKVFFQQGERGEMEKEIRHLTKEYGIPLQVVPREKLNKMVRGQHQGVVAHLALVEFQNLEDVLPFVFEQGQTPLFVMLDGVTDVRNFGAICRSAECAGAHAVIVPQSGSALAKKKP